MKTNNNLNVLFANYKNLTDEQVTNLIISILKEEKDILGITYPLLYVPVFKEYECGGNCSINYNEETKRDEITIEINYTSIINNFITNKNNQNKLCDRGLETLYQLITTLCHEMRHAYQKTSMLKKNTFDYNGLMWLKESIVISSISKETYNNNHNNWLQEQDAYKYMFDRGIYYIEKYFPKETLTQEQIESFNNFILAQKKYKIVDSLYIDFEGKQIEIKDFINERMEKEIKNLSEEAITSTLLRHEYNTNKIKKTTEEMEQDRDNILENLKETDIDFSDKYNNIKNFYDLIILDNQSLLTVESNELDEKQLYEQAFLKRKKAAEEIEKLMLSKQNYSEVEYNQRLKKLVEARDAAQKEMTKYFNYYYKVLDYQDNITEMEGYAKQVR